MRGVSVVICCFNSSKRLPDTLAHLLNQRTDAALVWEVIIVDNGSSDNTKGIAESFKSQFTQIAAFSVVTELQSGLNYARRKGVYTSQYDYILFCDDDNWLECQYVQRAFDLMESDSSIGACGAKGIAECERSAPQWFGDFERQYAVGEPAVQTGTINDIKGFITGAGMCLRKHALSRLEKAGFKSLLTDRKGTSLSSGGDLELCYALRIAGYKIYYLEGTYYQHFIPNERLTIGYLERLHVGFGKSNVVLDAYLYILNGWDTNKRWIWLRNVVLLTPQIVKAQLKKTKSVSEAMDFLLLKQYYLELLRINRKFDGYVKQIKTLKMKIV